MEVAEVWAKGGEGAEKLAILTAKVAEQCLCKLQPLYEWNWCVEKKIETIAKEIYGAAAIDYTAQAKSDLKKFRLSVWTNYRSVLPKLKNLYPTTRNF